MSRFWSEQQLAFVSMLSDMAPSISSEHGHLAAALESVQIEAFAPLPKGTGRPPLDRRALVRAFFVKAIRGSSQTEDLHRALRADHGLAVLCGFKRSVPSLSTFSRAFAEFARMGLCDMALSSLARKALGEQLVMHVCRDSTAICVRERPHKKPKVESKPKGKPGRKKGVPPKPKVSTRQERQLDQDPHEAIKELPQLCDVGTKKNSKGHDMHWNGYKFHVDVTGDGLPISAVTTSASVHDSQVAIPLMKLSAQRVLASCYQLMDAGYVGGPIRTAAENLKQIPIIAPKGKRGAEAIPLDKATQRRYGARTAIERFFADLKDNRGASQVRVRGQPKVHLHLMFGLIAIFALHLLSG